MVQALAVAWASAQTIKTVAALAGVERKAQDLFFHEIGLLDFGKSRVRWGKRCFSRGPQSFNL
jgi:hypothetical protein